MKKRGKQLMTSPGGGESFDDLARRHRGDRPTAARTVRRRGEGAAAIEDGDVVTDAVPDEINMGAIQLGQARAGLRVPMVDGERLRTLAGMVDPSVGYVIPNLADFLGAFPRVSGALQLTPVGLRGQLQQRTEMFELRGTASQVRQDVTDSRRETGERLRGDMGLLAALIREQLQPGARPKQEQDRLRSDSLEFLQLWEQVEQAPQLQREKTQLEEAARAETLSAEEQQAEYLRTMLALERGDEVDETEWDRAAAAYDALSESGASENRRRRGR